MGIRRILLATAAALPMAAGAAQAQIGGAGQPVTGLYIAGGGGLNWLQNTEIEAQNGFGATLRGAGVSSTGKGTFDLGWGVVASVGWGFGNGLRLEVEGNFRQNNVSTIRGFAPLAPWTAVGGRQRSVGVMANVLYDVSFPFFGINFPYVQPYVGLGAGYVWSEWENVRGISPTGFAVRSDDQQGEFAYQAIVGAAFPVQSVPGLSITAEYRFLGTLSPTYDATVRDVRTGAVVAGGRVETDNFNHSAMIGVRYAFNQPRAAPPPAPSVAPAPARSFLVFFDFDRADLTERSRSIISDAAQASRSQQVTRIEVAGHADRSGTPQYNQGLSQRRANNVASELVRQGVPRQAISVAAFGESRPLVPTGDGVREPQNRRVEIVLR